MIIDTAGYLSPELSKNFPSAVPMRTAGVYSHGLYLETDDGDLLMIHDGKFGNIPFGIAVIECEKLLKYADIGIGSKAELLNNDLLIYENRKGLKIRLHTCENESSYAGGAADIELFCEVAGRKLMETDRGTLKNLADNGFPETSYSKTAKTIIRGRKLSDAAGDILGLGPGLTPSGDDFVCGWLYYSLHCLNEAEQLVSVINSIKQNMSLHTTKVSCAFLKAVADGGRFDLFDEVCFAENEDTLNTAIDGLLDMGSNSGADVLSGMLCAASGGFSV